MSIEDDGREAAEGFRREEGLGVTPLGDLAALIDLTRGIDIAILEADMDEHGMTMRDPSRGVSMIAVASTMNPARQRSTLAHELAHIVFDDFAPLKNDGWDERSHIERRADTFARHLLVPIDGLKIVLGDSEVALKDLSMLVQRFQASPAIVAIQAEIAGYISPSTKQQWKAETTPNLAARFGWSDQYRLWQQESSARRAPQRLLARAVEGYIANVVTLQSIARLRGLESEEVQREFEEAGIRPAEKSVEWASAADLPEVDLDFSDLDALEAEERGR